jgi:hypothetical protein
MFLARAASPVARPDLAARVLGSTPNPSQVPPYVDFQTSHRVIGRRGGYESFEQALIGTMHATLGDRVPAAAILRVDGRFYAQGVDMLTTVPEHRGQDTVQLAKLRFERDSSVIADVELATSSVVAFVDGLSSLIFGDPTRD